MSDLVERARYFIDTQVPVVTFDYTPIGKAGKLISEIADRIEQLGGAETDQRIKNRGYVLL